jgi:predicted 3-demethylubiquinone-9 3-methyltransferase (glyoxalase superfamily)
MEKIIPFLWFEDNAEEAVNFYVSVFRNSRIVSVTHYGAAAAEAAGMQQGGVMTIAFELEGQPFIALNGGPGFDFNPAISFAISCDSQEEIDVLWEKLSEEGTQVECGWLEDRFGISWQIVPSVLGKMITDPDHERADRVTRALLGMKKIDLAALKRAFDQEKAA